MTHHNFQRFMKCRRPVFASFKSLIHEYSHNYSRTFIVGPERNQYNPATPSITVYIVIITAEMYPGPVDTV